MTTWRRIIRLLLTLSLLAEVLLLSGAWYAFTNARPDYLLAFGGHFAVYLALPVALVAATLALLSKYGSAVYLAATLSFALLSVYIVVDLLRLFAYVLRMSSVP